MMDAILGPPDYVVAIIQFNNAESYTRTMVTNRTYEDVLSKVAGFVTLIFYVIQWLISRF